MLWDKINNILNKFDDIYMLFDLQIKKFVSEILMNRYIV